MMNIPPRDAKALTMREYEMLLHHWNEAHDSGDVEPPDHETTQKLIDRINSDPRLYLATAKV